VCVVKGGFLFLSFYLGSLGGGEVVRSVAVGDGKASGREAAYSNAAYAMLCYAAAPTHGHERVQTGLLADDAGPRRQNRSRGPTTRS
jgi:hypothetical protein